MEIEKFQEILKITEKKEIEKLEIVERIMRTNESEKLEMVERIIKSEETEKRTMIERREAFNRSIQLESICGVRGGLEFVRSQVIFSA